jgi:hypothetical protein
MVITAVDRVVSAGRPAWAGMALLLVACNSTPPPSSTGGVDGPRGPCGYGLVVINSDYISTNVSLVGLDGSNLSASIISSSTEAVGLTAPLSGDVVVPTTPQLTDEIVIIDRYPASVLTWVDVHSGQPSSQLSVATGFASNPQDYLQVSPTVGFVTRFEPDPSIGDEAFDGGNDVLVIDPTIPAIIERIDLMPAMAGEDPKFFPRANRMVSAKGMLYVLLSSYAKDFSSSAESRIVTIDLSSRSIIDVTKLSGLHGCAGLAMSPEDDELAVTCSGTFLNNSESIISESGLVVLGIDGSPHELQRWLATDLGEGPLGFSAAYASANTLIVTTFGSYENGTQKSADDTTMIVDLETGAHMVLFRSEALPFSIGEVQCAAECAVCFIADAERDGGVLHRLDVGASGELVESAQIQVSGEIGLPPRYVGRF